MTGEFGLFAETTAMATASGVTFYVSFDASHAINGLTSLLERIENPTGFFRNVGEYMVSEGVRERFQSETAPDGTPWAALKQATIDRRTKSGHTPIRILRSGEADSLFSSLTYQTEGEGVRIGTSREYATTHQFGAAQGSFGTSAKGKPLPWGTIPARPFIGVSPTDEERIIEICRDWLEIEGK